MCWGDYGLEHTSRRLIATARAVPDSTVPTVGAFDQALGTPGASIVLICFEASEAAALKQPIGVA